MEEKLDKELPLPEEKEVVKESPISEIQQLKNEIEILKSQLTNLKSDNTTLFNTINSNLDKIVKNTSKEEVKEVKKRF